MDFERFRSHINVSRETFEQLEIYAQLLLKWQKKINLISQHTVEDVWIRHILDGAQVLNHFHPNSNDVFFDMGCGGGVPGVILGLCLGNEIHLQESDSRKAVFLNTVSRETSRGNIHVYNGRIEDSTLRNAQYGFARALAPLNKLLALALPQLSENNTCIFHKGIHGNDEIAQAKLEWDFTYEHIESITQKGSGLLKISNIKPRS